MLPVKHTLATWNVRTLNTEGNQKILLNEISKFKIDLLGVSETYWNNTLTEAFEQLHYHPLMQERWHKATRRRNNSRKAAIKIDAVLGMSQRTSPKCYLRHGRNIPGLCARL